MLEFAAAIAISRLGRRVGCELAPPGDGRRVNPRGSLGHPGGAPRNRGYRHMRDELTDRPRFVVWRAAPGVPLGWMPAGMEGRWDYRPEPPEPWARKPRAEDNAYAIAVRTNRIEHRDSDGASAEVWEVHPAGGNYPDDPADRLPLW